MNVGQIRDRWINEDQWGMMGELQSTNKRIDKWQMNDGWLMDDQRKHGNTGLIMAKQWLIDCLNRWTTDEHGMNNGRTMDGWAMDECGINDKWFTNNKNTIPAKIYLKHTIWYFGHINQHIQQNLRNPLAINPVRLNPERLIPSLTYWITKQARRLPIQIIMHI